MSYCACCVYSKWEMLIEIVGCGIMKIVVHAMSIVYENYQYYMLLVFFKSFRYDAQFIQQNDVYTRSLIEMVKNTVCFM